MTNFIRTTNIDFKKIKSNCTDNNLKHNLNRKALKLKLNKLHRKNY